MKFILSPAKLMDINSTVGVDRKSVPHFIQKAEVLQEVMKKKSPKDLMKLMNISQKLAEENWERYQDWKPNPNEEEGLQAFLIFKGEVYRGLEAETLPTDSYDYLAENMHILSGLYGLLNAFDFIMPYRLEMGARLKYRRKNNLYEYWGTDLTYYLNSFLQENEYVVDLASNEYSKVIDKKALKGKYVEIAFKDYREGKLRSIMTFFKHARGAMMRECAVSKVETLDELKSLVIDDYTFDEKISTEQKLIFTR